MSVSFKIIAIKDDLKKIFTEYENIAFVKYYKCGAFENNEKSVVKSMSTFKKLGISINGKTGDNKYLVMKSTNTCKFREVANSNREVKYFIDDIKNKKTFTIDLQGVYGENNIVVTTVNNIYDVNSTDSELYNIFKQVCNKYCREYSDNCLIGLCASKLKDTHNFVFDLVEENN